MVSIVDGVLHHLGKPGGFHLLVTVLLCCNFFPITFHHLSFIFFGDSIPHTCRLPEGWPWHKKFSIPRVASSNGEQSKYDQCHMFVDPNSANLGTKSCVYGWDFYPQGREWTIISEWGLVCEREYLVTLASVVYHGGVMFGGLVFGTLADKFGRKPLMLFTLYVQTAISIGIYFVQNFILFVILRFIHGLLLQGLQCTTICLVMELLPMRYRTAAGMGCSIVWALAVITLSLVSYSVQHWRYIQLAISLPCVVTFLYIWLIPESVRWLLTVMKTENALIAARKFEHFNKRPLGEEFSKDVELATKQITSGTGHVESYGMRELLLQGSKLRISSLVLCFCWFATSSLYHGLSIVLIEIGSSRYTSTLILGAVDLVAFVVMYFLLVRFGRKRPLCALLVVCGAVCISTVIAENLEKGDGLEVYVVSTVMALVERSCIAACISGLAICAAELFPTVVRTFGIGVCLFCGQVGWIMAPHILKLGQFSLKSLPWIVFGILNLLAGLLVLLLPETLTKPLPDTLEDMESFESRKAPLKNKEKETTTPTPTGYVDWKTTYKQKIEEANGNLALADSGDDQKAEHSEKRWYKRSAKVVRFYGLDCSEDPCQEVKTSKKQRIRMVRFSFENEEFCIDPNAQTQAAVRRFSVIREEPELETAFDEDTAESSLEDIDETQSNNVLRTSHGLVKSKISSQKQLLSDKQKPEYSLRKAMDLTLRQNLFLGAAVLSVQPESTTDDTIMATPPSPSRFVVRRVSEPQVQLQLESEPDNCCESQDGADISSNNSEDAHLMPDASCTEHQVSELKTTPTDVLDQSSHSSTFLEDSLQVLVEGTSDLDVTAGTSQNDFFEDVADSEVNATAVSSDCCSTPAVDIGAISSGCGASISESLLLAPAVSQDDVVDNDRKPDEIILPFAVRNVADSEVSNDVERHDCESVISPQFTPSGEVVPDCNCSYEDNVSSMDVADPIMVTSSRFMVRRVSESKLPSSLVPSSDILQCCDCTPFVHTVTNSLEPESECLACSGETNGSVKNGGLASPSASSRFAVRRVSESDSTLQHSPLPNSSCSTILDTVDSLETGCSRPVALQGFSAHSLQSTVSQVEDVDMNIGVAGRPASSRFTIRRVSESKLSEPASSLLDLSNVNSRKLDSGENAGHVNDSVITDNSKLSVSRMEDRRKNASVAVCPVSSRFTVCSVSEPRLAEPLSCSVVETSDGKVDSGMNDLKVNGLITAKNPDACVSEMEDSKKDMGCLASPVSSRFTVRRISESKLPEPVSSSQVVPDVSCDKVDLGMAGTQNNGLLTTKNSRFTVCPVSESKMVPGITDETRVPATGVDDSNSALISVPSRFKVQKVTEPHLQDSYQSTNGSIIYDASLILDSSQLLLTEKSIGHLVHCDSNDVLNFENVNNNNDTYIGFKNVLDSSISPIDKADYEKLQNLNNSGACSYNSTSGNSLTSKFIVLPT